MMSKGPKVRNVNPEQYPAYRHMDHEDRRHQRSPTASSSTAFQQNHQFNVESEFENGKDLRGLSRVFCNTMTLSSQLQMAAGPMDFKTVFLQQADELIKEVQHNTGQKVDKLFGHAYTPLDAIVGLYMYNHYKISKHAIMAAHELMNLVDEDVDAICKCVASLYTLMNTVPNCTGNKDLTLTDYAKLLAYWGSPRRAANCMWHGVNTVHFYSPNGKESGIGGKAADDGNNDVVYFDGHNGISWLIITAAASACNVAANVHKKTDDKSGEPAGSKNPVNYHNASSDYHIICIPCIPLPVINKDVMEQTRRLAAKLGLSCTNNMFLTHQRLLKATFNVNLKTVSIAVTDDSSSELDSDNPSSSSTKRKHSKKASKCHDLKVTRGYLMRSPSRMKHCTMVKEWFVSGARMDLPTSGAPIVKSHYFSQSMKKLKETNDPRMVLNWTIKGPGGDVAASKDGIILLPQFANWLFGRNGNCDICEAKGRLSADMMYDPPMNSSKSTVVVSLCSGDWDVCTAVNMVDNCCQKSVVEYEPIPLKKLSIGNIQMFVAAQMCGALKQDISLVKYLTIPADIQKEMETHKGCMMVGQQYYAPTCKQIFVSDLELVKFVRVCGSGVLRGPDARLFELLRIVTDVLANTGHGPLGRRKDFAVQKIRHPMLTAPTPVTTASTATPSVSRVGKTLTAAARTLVLKSPVKEPAATVTTSLSPCSSPEPEHDAVNMAIEMAVAAVLREDAEKAAIATVSRSPEKTPPPVVHRSRKRRILGGDVPVKSKSTKKTLAVATVTPNIATTTFNTTTTTSLPTSDQTMASISASIGGATVTKRVPKSSAGTSKSANEAAFLNNVSFATYGEEVNAAVDLLNASTRNM